ncbi:class I SAM-dependent methyltransferase [Methyloglobulus sp.]|uniref:class I SAM-dependent methyltransferase n=1 Tax=Methyloglobulus sp. TaxID=2518622 RepID=UPI0032B7AEDA
MIDCQGKLAVLYEGQGDISAYQQLAEKLQLPFYQSFNDDTLENFFLSWREGSLSLIDRNNLKSSLSVEIEHRPGEQLSWPIAKTGALAQALGRKTKTVVDATAGWGQDSLAMFRMGYVVLSLERSPVMAELLADGFKRLQQLAWVQQLNLAPPQLQVGNAIEILEKLEFKPDCIYLDPMFPPKRKKSALAKKSIMVLRDLVGDDMDKAELFSTALKATGKRVVVKSPDYAEPLGGKPNESFQGKLLRYDVYLK